MQSGISPVVATVLLIAIAVIASVTVWFWVSPYAGNQPIVETAQKSYIVTAIYKNSSKDGCISLDIQNTGATSINNLVLELRDFATGRAADSNNTWLYDPALVSYWKLDGSGIDEKNVNHGAFGGETLSNGTFYNGPLWTTGKHGNAVQFNTTNYIITINDSALNLRYNGTIVAWIKTTSQAKNTIAGKLWNVDPWPGWVFDTNQNTNTSRLCFWAGNGSSGGTWQCGNTNITTGAWQHAAISWFNTSSVAINVTFYIDGAYDGSVIMRVPAGTNQSLTIGMENSTASPNALFNGVIDSLRIWNFNLSQAQIQAEMNSPYPITRPIAGWEFNEGVGAAINDTHTLLAGKFSGAYSFDGIDDFVDVGNSSSLNLGQGTPFSPFSISAWFKLDSLSGVNAMGIINWGEQTNTKRRSIIIWNNRIYFSGYGTSSNLDSGVTVTTGIWYHAVAIVDSSKYAQVYVNGVLKNASTLTLNDFNFANGTSIGKTRAIPQELFNGTIDDVAVFNRSLSATEVSNLYYDGRFSLSDDSKPVYLNITVELAPRSSYNYNLSSFGNASSQVSVPKGTYLLRATSYSSSMKGFSDITVTCA